MSTRSWSDPTTAAILDAAVAERERHGFAAWHSTTWHAAPD